MGRILEYFALSGLGSCVALLIGTYLWRLSGRIRLYARRYGVLGILALGLSLFAALTEGPPDEDYKDAVQEELDGEGETNAVFGAMMLMVPRHAPSAPMPPTPTISYAMPTNAVSYEPWNLRGAAEDWFKLDFGDWRFPMGTNEYSTFQVFTDGTIRPKLHSTNDAIVAVGAAMSAIPDVSRFWYSVGTNDSRILTWAILLPEDAPLSWLTWHAKEGNATFPNGNVGRRVAVDSSSSALILEARINGYDDEPDPIEFKVDVIQEEN